MSQTQRIGETPNQIIKDYEIIKKLGEGGMAIVYLARHTTIKNRYYAIKKIQPQFTDNDYVRTKFLDEANILADVSRHPNIVNFVNFIEEGGIHYIVMDFITTGKLTAEGYPQSETLADVIRREGGIDWVRCFKWFGQLCDAVGYAHSKGVIHRDLKPSNILIDEFDNIQVADFGIAKILTFDEKTGKTLTGTIVGTPEFMAPEQIFPERFGRLGPHTDIYALGIILYKMLTGVYPYDYETTTNPFRIQKAHVEEVPDLSRVSDEGLRMIIAKCLQKNPEDRYQSVEELLEDIEDVSKGTVKVEAKPTIKAPQKVIMPLLVGKTKESAIRELERLGLGYKIKYIEGKDGIVFGQDVADGVVVERSKTITLVVGKELKHKIVVPRVTGLEEKKAIAILREEGFEYNISGYEYSIYNPGIVIQQEPEPPQALEKGDVVRLTISLGKKEKHPKKVPSKGFVIPIIIGELIFMLTAVGAIINMQELHSTDFENAKAIFTVLVLGLYFFEIILQFCLIHFLLALFTSIITTFILLGYAQSVECLHSSPDILTESISILNVFAFTLNGAYLFRWMNASKFLRIICIILAILIFVGGINYLCSGNYELLQSPLIFGLFCGLSARIASFFKKEKKQGGNL